MKPIYLPLIFSLFMLSGCSDKDATEATTSSASDKEEVSIAEAETDKKKEKCVIPKVEGYERVGCLRDGLAGVISLSDDGYDNNISNRVGYIDKDGQLVIPFEFDGIPSGEGGDYLDFNDFSEGLAAVSKNDKYGFINAKGEFVIEPKYDWANSFSDGLAVVSLDGKSGAIDKAGKTIIPFEYEFLGSFQNGFATAARPTNDAENYDRKYGLINKQNEVIIPFMYDEMGDLSESLIAVKKDGKWGYVDTNNKPVIPINLAYETVNGFSDGLAAVFNYEENSDNYKYGYIDKTGKLIIPMQFLKVYWDDSEGFIDFNNGIAIISDREGRTICIDKKGNQTQCPEGVGDTDDTEQINEGVSVEDEILEAENYTSNFSESFDTRPVLPTVEKMRNVIWAWENFADLPNVGKLEPDSQSKNRYTLTQTISDENPQTTITFYGTKERPEVAVVESRTWGAGNTQNTQFVRIDELKGIMPLNSNCNFKNVSFSEISDDGDGYSYETGASVDFQQVYQLPKNISSLSPAKNNLYLASSQIESYVVTSTFQTQAYTMSIVTPEKNKLSQFINSYGWSTNDKGQEVSCNVN